MDKQLGANCIGKKVSVPTEGVRESDGVVGVASAPARWGVPAAAGVGVRENTVEGSVVVAKGARAAGAGAGCAGAM